jgi:hypothetical protein
LIANPGIEGEELYCKGVFADMDNFKKFLLSPIGGLWKDGEIITKIKPTKIELLKEIEVLKSVDYGLVIFSGHGWHSGQLDETMVKLNDNESISSKELRKGAPKQTLILDCCREIHSEPVKKMFECAFEKMSSQIHPEDCRFFYDNQIIKCANSIIVLYGCDINETAGESLSGGYFSYRLINSSKEWASRKVIDTTKQCSILSMVEAFETTDVLVKEFTDKRQNPQIEKPRSEIYFPFCIVA